MKMLEFIKGYNTYKLTESEAEKVFANKNFSGLSERIELGLVNSERCVIDADAREYYDEGLNDYITCMIFRVFEVTEEDFRSIQEAYTLLQKEADSTDSNAYTHEKSFKHVATYRCNTDEECRDFLSTIIKNFNFDISV